MDSSSRDRFAHEILPHPDRQIRLLTIFPSRDINSVIESRLSIYELPLTKLPWKAKLQAYWKLPPYFAVSHVWPQGEKSAADVKIIINGAPFVVTGNMHRALVQFRQFFPVPMSYWIDTICIDQGKDEEKTKQVALMCDIYAIAYQVWIWLGESTPETEMALRFVNQLTISSIYLTLGDMWLDFIKANSNHTSGPERWSLLAYLKTETFWIVHAIILVPSIWFSWFLFIIVDVWAPPRSFIHRTLGSLVDNNANLHTEGITSTGESNPQTDWKVIKTPFDENGAHATMHGDTSNFHFKISADIAKQKTDKAWQKWKPTKTCLQAAIVDFETAGGTDIVDLILSNVVHNTQYFNRMWTMQEASVGRVVTMVCGSKIVTLWHFLIALHYICRTQGKTALATKFINLSYINDSWRRNRRLKLRHLLYECRDRHCRNQNDRVYALLGLTFEPPDPLLAPDYKKSVSEVFANAARFIIYTERSLDIICAGGSASELEMPSWTPDFRSFGSSNGRTRLVSLGADKSIFQASAISHQPLITPTLESSEKWQILKTLGYRISKIVQVSDSDQPDKLFISKLDKWRDLTDSLAPKAKVTKTFDLVALCLEFLELLETENGAYFGGESPSAYHRVATLTETPRTLHLPLLLTLMCGRISATMRYDEEDIRTLLGRVPDNPAKVLWLLGNALRDGMCDRQLAKLDYGLTAAVPLLAETGDVICTLHGCSVPVVLRWTAGRHAWKVVGESYVHGFMDGQAEKGHRDGKVTQYTFTLI